MRGDEIIEREKCEPSVPFLRSSGLPSLTVAITISPIEADGRRFKRPLYPFTEITYKFFAPVLSAQFMIAPVGRPNEMRNLPPAVPRAKKSKKQKMKKTS
jgi:hypothetical protein